MEQYTYVFDNELESDQFKNLLDTQGISYQLKNYTLLGDSFTDVTIDAQIKPAVDTLYLKVIKYGIKINPLKWYDQSITIITTGPDSHSEKGLH